MMTVHKLSVGDGYSYYTNEVASGDELRSKDRTLGDYYTVDGNPPGQWMGGGIAHHGVAGEVSEQQMKSLFGDGVHPEAERMLADGATVKEVRLGQKYRESNHRENVLGGKIAFGYMEHERRFGNEPGRDERRIIRTGIAAEYFRELHGRNAQDKEELGRFITQQQKGPSQAVAGYDLVFAPAKSASVLWALGGAQARQAVEAAHSEAIKEALAHFEASGLYTRRGRNGVRQIDVAGGVVATSYRHYDSRNGDPQLHDHVVVSNKVLGVDGKWGTLDGQQLHKLGVEVSEFYNQKVMEKIAARLDVELVDRLMPGRRPVVEIAGVDMAAIESASSRRKDISAQIIELTGQFVDNHGYEPNTKQRIALAQQATLQTRPAKKTARSLSALVQEWTADFTTAGLATGEELWKRVHQAKNELQQETLFPSQVDTAAVAASVIGRLEEDRSTWSAHHVRAQARRTLRAEVGAREIPETLIEHVTREALDKHSLTTNTVRRAPVDSAMTRSDGTSVYTKANSQVYTSVAVLARQDRLLKAAQLEVIPAATQEAFERALGSQEHQLDAGQRALAQEFACGSRLLSVGIGAAGTGKTTAMRLAADTVREAGGRVIGLAPTAAAAKLMGTEIGATATTIDSFVLRHQRNTSSKIPLNPGDVIVVDEAGMARTDLLASVVTIAQDHGALVRLIGDERQLAAVGAGGALRLIRSEVGAVELEDLHRFINPDEAAATLALREAPLTGTDRPWEFYRTNKRVMGGADELMIEKVFTAWQKDVNAGTAALMLASDNDSVTALNERAQAYRLSTGKLGPGPRAVLRDGLIAHTGDLIITRCNDRTLTVNRGHDFVKNNDTWTVERVHDDGALSVKNTSHSGHITLPAEYVREHSMLGYACTIHRSQGQTTQRTHALISSDLSRSLAYVAASRGREENRLYVSLTEGETLDGALEKVAANTETNVSAQEQLDAQRAEAHDVVRLSAEYNDLETHATGQRLENIARSALGEAIVEPLLESEAWGAVTAQLANAEKAGHEAKTLLVKAWQEADLGGVRDRAAVLAARITKRMERGTAIAAATIARPAQNISDEHLEKLRGYARLRTRGTKTLLAKESAHAVYRRIVVEQTFRDLVPAPAVSDQGTHQGPCLDVPEWLAPEHSINRPGTPELLRLELSKRRIIIDAELTRRGYELANKRPPWTQQLGEPSAHPEKQRQWIRLAAEVDTYRRQYNIGEHETTAVPSKYRQSGTGQSLAVQVTALHKASLLTTKPAAEQAELYRASIGADAAAIGTNGRTEAEIVADVLRSQDTEQLSQSAAQLRRNNLAAAIEADPTQAGNDAGIQAHNTAGTAEQPDAVKWALAKIQAQKQLDTQTTAETIQPAKPAAEQESPGSDISRNPELENAGETDTTATRTRPPSLEKRLAAKYGAKLAGTSTESGKSAAQASREAAQQRQSHHDGLEH